MRNMDSRLIQANVRKIYWILSAQFGIDPRKTFRSLRGLPHYVLDFLRFRAHYTGRLELLPCLHDWYEEGGTTKDEYFWQDLLVARMIFAANPEKHVDIGSRVDGFVAHVASFREIEVFDVRSISSKIPGVIFKQANLMKPVDEIAGGATVTHFPVCMHWNTLDWVGMETQSMSKALNADLAIWFVC